MWTVAAANKRFKGSLGNYNGLTDQHLAHYFSSPVIKAHLIKTGLVTRDGTIIPESDLKVQYIKKQRRREYQELLAQAIVQKALHLENVRQAKIREHLEDIAKIELVERIKRPHTVGAIPKSCKQPAVSESPYQYSCSSTSLKGSAAKKRAKSSDYARGKLKTRASRKLSRSISSSKSRSSDYNLDFRNMGSISPFKFQEGNKAYVRNKKTDDNKCQVTLYYHGNKIFWWMNKLQDQDQEIVIKQQHCGGNPVVVFKGTKTAKEHLTFTSHRHAGYPFSITIFIDGLRDLKLSACCEYRYQRGSRLGGKTGHFTFVSAEGGSPCIQCQDLIESRWMSRSPVLFLPRTSHQVSLMNTFLKSEPYPDARLGVTDYAEKENENFAFVKEDNASHTGSEVQEEEIKETVECIQDNEDAEEVPDEVESLKADEDEVESLKADEDEVESLKADEDEVKSLKADEDEVESLKADEDEVESLKADEVESLKADENEDVPVTSEGEGSPESVKSEVDNPLSEGNEAYSEVDAGPEQCVDLEYNNDSGDDGDVASHRTASSASNNDMQQPPPPPPPKDDSELRTLNLDARSMSEDEGAEEHVVVAEVHASDTSDV